MGFGLTTFGGGGTKNCGGGGSPTSFNRSGVGGGTSNMGGAGQLSSTCLTAGKGANGAGFAFHCSKSMDEHPVRKKIPLTRAVFDKQLKGGRMLRSIGDCFEVVAGVSHNNSPGFLANQCNKIATIEV